MSYGGDAELKSLGSEDDDEYSAVSSEDDVARTGGGSKRNKNKAGMFPDMEGQVTRTPSVHSLTSVDELRSDLALIPELSMGTEKPPSAHDSTPTSKSSEDVRLTRSAINIDVRNH